MIYLLMILACFFYWLIIHFYWTNWKRLKAVQLIPEPGIPFTRFSVIIPARNEEQHISSCLESILANNYPSTHVEIIVVDDHSEDNTAAIVSTFAAGYPNIRLLSLKDFVEAGQITAYKKEALKTGIQHAQHSIIITTDADCIVPPDWLAFFHTGFLQPHIRMLAAPVNFYRERNLLGFFQSLDFMGMMLITGAGIQSQKMHMANGANLAYTKETFEAVAGFTGIDQLASGDDMLLMQKIARQFPDSISFIKNPDATVLTPAQPDWRSFVRQRIRWASKSGIYPEQLITLQLALIFFYCWAILIGFTGSLWLGTDLLYPAIGLLLFKTVVDYFFLRKATQFFGRPQLLRFFLPSQFLHIFYIAVIGLAANLSKQYVWKGRRVR